MNCERTIGIDHYPIPGRIWWIRRVCHAGGPVFAGVALMEMEKRRGRKLIISQAKLPALQSRSVLAPQFTDFTDSEVSCGSFVQVPRTT